MDTRQAISVLTAAGDANARVTLPFTIGIARWTDGAPALIRRLGIEAGLDRVSTRVRGILMARVVTVGFEGPADSGLRFIARLQELAD